MTLNPTSHPRQIPCDKPRAGDYRRQPVGALESEDRKEVKGRFDELVEYELSNGVLKEIAERAARPCHIPHTEIVK